MTDGDKIKDIRKALRLTQAAFGEPINISKGHLSNVETNTATLSSSAIELLKIRYAVNPVWWQTGEGAMFLNQDIEQPDVEIETEEKTETCLKVEIFNMVDAGNGAEPDWHEPIDTRLIPSRYIRKGIRPVLVRGRSMEPTFQNGAIIGVNEYDKDVIEGDAYAVLLPYSGAAVKRLYPVPDGVIIRSDNKEFPEVKLKKDDVPDHFILGRVCWVVQDV